MRIAICVCTCARPKGLARLLDGVARLEVADGADPTVLVVDNNADAAARVQVEAARLAGFPWPLRHVHEPRRGISQARNRALAETRDADVIAFLDDDEVPRTDWLRALLAAQAATGADAVAGAVVPRFEEAPPGWAMRGGFFAQAAEPELAPIRYAYTNNVLVRRVCIDRLGLAFDDALGLTGGEDLCFFAALADGGGRIVWTNRAVVEEFIPSSRVRAGWLLRRWVRTGAADGLLLTRRTPGPAGRLRLVAGGMARVALGGAALVPALVLGGVWRWDWPLRRLKTVCRGLGMLGEAAGWRYQEYRRIHGR